MNLLQLLLLVLLCLGPLASGQSFQDSLFEAISNLGKTKSPTPVVESTSSPAPLAESLSPTSSPTPVLITTPEDPPTSSEAPTASPHAEQVIVVPGNETTTSTDSPTTTTTGEETLSPTAMVIVPGNETTDSPTVETGAPLATLEPSASPSATVKPSASPATTGTPTLLEDTNTTATASPSSSPSSTVVPPAGANSTSAPTLSPSSAIEETNSTLAPTLAADNSTQVPTMADNSTQAPTVASNSTLAPTSVDNSTLAPTLAVGNSTLAPTVAGNSTLAPTSADNSTLAPTLADNSTLAPTLADNFTLAPTPTSNSTLAPTLANNSTTASNSTLAPTLAENSTTTGNSTLAPTVLASNSTTNSSVPTFAPTPINGTRAPTVIAYTDIGNNATLNATTVLLYNCSSLPIRSVEFWNCSAINQLALFERAGEETEYQVTTLLLATHRVCDHKSNVTTFEQALQLRLALDVVQNISLPNLRSNRTASEDLLLVAGSERKGFLAAELRNAAISSVTVIQALERLVDSAIAVQNSSANCLGYFTPKIQDLRTYQLQEAPNEVSITSIVLAALLGVIGFLILLLPAPGGSVLVFVVTSTYIWAFVAYMAAWYSFGLMDSSSWQGSNWWRAFYSINLIGLAAWLLAMCVAFAARRNWLAMGAISGLGFGGVLGIQLNTVAFWRLGGNGLAPYFTISLCMSVGAGLFCLVFLLWAHLKPSWAIVHLTGSLVGSYFFIKMIGVLVGNYPTEIYIGQSPSTTPGNEVYAYVVSMWILALLMFTCQCLVYPVLAPIPVAVDPKKHDPEDDVKAGGQQQSSFWSKKNSNNSGMEERAPLLTGSSETRRRKQEEDVVEFGGVRALKSEGGQSTKSLLV
ncbi:hypothetical protein BASA81_001901 [Batrachochytrium salamandrivorans]|nr:hypothetical protein BASA81_001901 [Batrachochytrium salamandrivorans]